MATKLTLTLNKRIIERAKKYAEKHGRSLSDIVENYFKLLTLAEMQPATNTELSEKIKRLKGIAKVDKHFDYKKILEEELNKKFNE